LHAIVDRSWVIDVTAGIILCVAFVVQFKREVEFRTNLSAGHVIAITVSSEDDQLRERWSKDVSQISGFIESENSRKDDSPEQIYHFGMVMERGQRSLLRVLMQENNNLHQQRSMLRSLFEIVRHLHGYNIIHADFKPLNILRLEDGSWRAIDFDASASIGSVVGNKTSSAYAPPELTANITKTKLISLREYETTRRNAKSKWEYSPHKYSPTAKRAVDAVEIDNTLLVAHPSYDFWSIGCIMFQALARRTVRCVCLM
jgi:serine/threonine protein kinase